MGFFAFMGSTTGRIVRAAAGLALIIAGALAGGGWWALAVVGLLPLAAGVFDFCLFAPLMRLPMGGKALRARLSR
jgi:hypothetical protein